MPELQLAWDLALLAAAFCFFFACMAVTIAGVCWSAHRSLSWLLGLLDRRIGL